METFEISLLSLKSSVANEYWSSRSYFKEKLKKNSGFNKITSYQSIKTNLEILDFCQWNSLEEAEKANLMAKNRKNYKPLNRLELFEYGHLLFDFRTCLKENSTTLMELYVYETSEEKVACLQNHRRILFEYLQKNYLGFVAIKGFQSFFNPKKQIDLFYFNETSDSRAINRKIRRSNFFKNFVETIDKTELLKTFKPINN